ncbi:MAG: CDGSH iron-sulfur domain-containing protein [Nannocystaceae bacterium]|nr:CDGSH iron-sulfur domain-containing protein [Myxococcales bacterium]
MEPRILIIGRLQEVIDPLVDALRKRGREVIGTDDRVRARAILEDRAIDLVVLGGGLPEPARQELEQLVRSIRPDTPVHLKEREGGPEALIPYIESLVERVKRARAAEVDVHTYPGEAVDVVWDGRLCIHVGECGRARGKLFVGGRKPWCQPDVASADEVAEVIQRCPTGALTVIRKDGGAEEQAPTQNTVVVSNSGPLYLRGDLTIEGIPEDMPGLRFRAALCRCGMSGFKPFCDNSHDEAGFRDHGAVGEQGPGSDERGGPLTVRVIKDGPLLLAGDFTIVAASGREAWRGTKAALCRCGGSKNRPFCDGTHRLIHFEG